ncbi:DNA/RNA non-specific endonuclease [Candidatus Bipolaricaulota bacterium]
MRSPMITRSGYDRGHLAPFKIAGGIRRGENLGRNSTFCDQALYEVNYMTNIAPQYPSFNQNGGLWYELESLIRERVAQGIDELWVLAGTIFWDGVVEMIGPELNVRVPQAFYKIVAWKPTETSTQALAFLFPHQKARMGEIEHFLVSIDLLEALTGFDFFTSMQDASEIDLEAGNTVVNLESFLSQQSR